MNRNTDCQECIEIRMLVAKEDVSENVDREYGRAAQAEHNGISQRMIVDSDKDK